MRLHLEVTHELPPQRLVTGQEMPEAFAAKPYSLVMMQEQGADPGPTPIDIVSVTTGGELSGYVIGQMLRAIAEDVEAADAKLNPPRPTIRNTPAGGGS